VSFILGWSGVEENRDTSLVIYVGTPAFGYLPGETRFLPFNSSATDG
jgi:hypothetical protein